MAFLLAAPPFNYSEGVIGLFGTVAPPGRWPLHVPGIWQTRAKPD